MFDFFFRVARVLGFTLTAGTFLNPAPACAVEESGVMDWFIAISERTGGLWAYDDAVLHLNVGIFVGSQDSQGDCLY
jgi:hypothetical protein